jgi:Ca-activated chloride channel family protein
MISTLLRLREKSLRPAFFPGVLALLFLGRLVSAQTRPIPIPTPHPREMPDAVRVSSNLVMMPVLVTDSQGQVVHGLKIEDFRLQEEERVQQITEMGDPELVPLDIALLLDISSSVSQKGFFTFQQTAAVAFLMQVMKSADNAAVFGISGQPVLISPLAPSQVTAETILKIPRTNSAVPTAFYDTVAAAAKYLIEKSPSGHRRVIIALTDGDDNFSKQIRDLSIEAAANRRGENISRGLTSLLQAKHSLAVQDTQRAVQEAEALFYSVNPGGPRGRMNVIATRAQTGMQTVADATGGSAFLPDSDKDLEKVFRQVAAELRGQYLLQYYRNSETPPGQFRHIKVETPAKPELKIRARQGYYAKQGGSK